MYEYIKGTVMESNPSCVVVECGGIGYNIHVSVNTYSQAPVGRDVLLYIHQIVREDAHLLYGFYTKEERSLFRSLISVSGIGANTANVMLSSMSVDEIIGAILTENVNAIKSVKGIGIKTAQRVIIELKDKVGKEGTPVESFALNNLGTMKEEAIAALTMLGFPKVQVSKTVEKLLASGPVSTVEELIKLALKSL